MFGFPFLSDARRYALQFPARAFDLLLRLLLLRIVHLRQSFRELCALCVTRPKAS
jgi:hypothetical protein